MIAQICKSVQSEIAVIDGTGFSLNNRSKYFRQFPDVSSIKRKFGELVYAKRFVSQKNELLARVLAYDINIIVNLAAVEIYFLQSPFSKKL